MPAPEPEFTLPTEPPASPTPPAAVPPPRPKRHWFRRLAVTFGVLVVVAGAGLGGAEYYTSRPQFCGTCHVMEPYYVSLSRDILGK